MVFKSNTIYIPIDNDYQYQLKKMTLKVKNNICIDDEFLVVIIDEYD
ncbi:hypothetical protein PROVRUST_05230 [Providencia rustigianii DSM 4541]|uniref:Uncharacterized protein n=1 Tax=Providencia rustigianii DSM 4541 TaxID=500637 RepID=D1NYA4_9GAMM|nr:hypothetical protein PROVRUST_05230 [Providencia rustigianii DSM 4541]